MPTLTIEKLLTDYRHKLKTVSERPGWEAELLLGTALNKGRAWLLAHGDEPLTSDQSRIASALLKRRLAGEPPAYISGKQEFYGLPFKVNKNVLIPRPETELIIEQITDRQQPTTDDVFVDVGTGSGCLIVSLAKNIKNKKAKFVGIDISARALTVAKQNAKINGVKKNIAFVQGDLLTPLFTNPKIKNCLKNSKVENLIIIANLPYLTPEQIAGKKSLQFEPQLALNGGPDGLKRYRRLARQLKKLKILHSNLLFTLYGEADPDQMSVLKKLFSPETTQIIKDCRKKNRFIKVVYR